MKKEPEAQAQTQTEPVDFSEAMKDYFRNYATYVIEDRAIPDIRDGLKPVQRRIIYSAHEKGYKRLVKSAKLVGNVIGDYHPHGDLSIYYALVSMTQRCKNNVPLFNDQGNWGDLDNPPAAYRYTETYLEAVTETLLNDVDFVPMVPSYDGSKKEPSVLPAELPWFWINGTTGIAVGMGTNVLPHNIGEIIDATLYLIDRPNCTPADLCKFVKCPDFPTGGYVTPLDKGEHGICSAYTIGKGSFRLRARIEKETTSTKKSVVIRELPYDVPPGRVKQQIVDMVREGKLEGIRNVIDESSDKTGMRIVVQLEQHAHQDIVINKLYQHTDCQRTVSMNAMGVHNKQPSIYSLRHGLETWLDFRRETITKRLEKERDVLERRLHILTGFFKIIGKIAVVIKEISESDDPKATLIEKFGLDSMQAEEVLSLTVRRLSKVGKDELTVEQKTKLERLADVKDTLAHADKLDDLIKAELKSHKKRYGHERRTEIVSEFADISIADVTPDEQVIVISTNDGKLKRVKTEEYRAQRKRGKGTLSSASGAVTTNVMSLSAHDDVLIITDHGRAYYLKAYHIPESTRTGAGADFGSLVASQPDEKITAILGVDALTDKQCVCLATQKGVVKRVEALQLKTNRKAGLQVIGLEDNDLVVGVALGPIEPAEKDDVLLFSKHGYVARFWCGHVRVQGRTAYGVAGIKLNEGDDVVSVAIVSDGGEGELLMVTSSSYGKRFKAESVHQVAGRGRQGAKTGNQAAGDIVGGFYIPPDSDGTLFLGSGNGKCIRVPLNQVKKLINKQGKGTQLQTIEDANVVAATVIFEKENEDDE